MNISCVIVNYNNAAYLGRAIDSVLSQSLLPEELIISDDCSTDSSVKLIKEYALNSSIIRPIYRRENLGAAANRDMAIRSAKGKYIVTLDSDDWFSIDKIEKEFNVISGRDDCIAVSDLALVDSEYSTIDTVLTREFCSKTNREQLLWLIARKRGGPVQMMFPKQLFIDVGGLNYTQALYEDWDFKIRAIQAGAKWVHSGVLGYYYWRIGEGLSSASFLKHTIFKLKVLARNYPKSPYKREFILGVFQLAFLKSVAYLSPRRKKSGFN